VFYSQTDKAAEWNTDMVWTDDSRLLQDSNLAARQPRRAPHHVIHLILQTQLWSEWRTSQPYGDVEFAAFCRKWEAIGSFQSFSALFYARSFGQYWNYYFNETYIPFWKCYRLRPCQSFPHSVLHTLFDQFVCIVYAKIAQLKHRLLCFAVVVMFCCLKWL